MFAAGNVVHVYDLVDWVTEAGLTAGRRAAMFAQGSCNEKPNFVHTTAGQNVRYVVPHKIDPETLTWETITIQVRVTQPIEEAVRVQITDGDTLIVKKRHRYARPGEMISLRLRERHYDAIREAKELKVSVVPV